jgi:hypothetical protein
MFQLSPLAVSPEILVAKVGTVWARNGRWILPEMPDFHVEFRNILHAVNLRHGTDGFTSPPKEGVLRIFSPWKIRRLRPGLNSRTWVPKASSVCYFCHCNSCQMHQTPQFCLNNLWRSDLNYSYRFSSYRAVDAVSGNNRCFFSRSTQNTQIHRVSRMLNSWMFNLVVHVVTGGRWKGFK